MKLNKNQRRKLSVFLKCVLFSFLAWALFAISNTYVYVKEVSLSYMNVPENKAFHPLQNDTANLRVEATGWQLLFSSLIREKKMVQVSLSDLRNRNYVIFSNQLGLLNRQFPSTQRVVSVQPDTLFFDFSQQTEKSVPVRVHQDLKFARQYGQIGPVESNPEQVIIRGPMEDVREITHWDTDTVRQSGINGSLDMEISLNTKQRPNLNVIPQVVNIHVPVGEMTEKELQVSVEVINDERYRSVKLLPGRVHLTVKVALSAYASISSDDFRAVVDMSDWHQQDGATLPVKIITKPDYCELIRVHPQNLDFFVNK